MAGSQHTLRTSLFLSASRQHISRASRSVFKTFPVGTAVALGRSKLWVWKTRRTYAGAGTAIGGESDGTPTGKRDHAENGGAQGMRHARRQRQGQLRFGGRPGRSGAGDLGESEEPPVLQRRGAPPLRPYARGG